MGKKIFFSYITGCAQEGGIDHINPCNGYKCSNKGFSMFIGVIIWSSCIQIRPVVDI